MVFLTRSESWLNNYDFDNIHSILEETIEIYVEEGDRIINIEMIEYKGSYRFWIYIERDSQ